MTAPSNDTRTWLDRLVSMDTTSRNSNRELIDAIADFARSLGLEPRIFDGRAEGKANMVISIPDASGSIEGGVMLAGHTDCVPVDGQDWASDPFTVTERDGRLVGRGVADMKGFIAAMTAALPAMVEKPLSRPLHLAYSYDEEVGCAAAPGFVEDMAAAGVRPAMGFVGEPSMMRMIRGHKSISLIRVVATGVPAHSSMTHQGVNAIEYVAEVVRYWRDQADRWKAEGPFDDAYVLPYASGSVNVVSGGNGVNIVPEAAEAIMEFRALPSMAPEQTIAELVAFVEQIDARMKVENPDAGMAVDVLSSTVGLDMAEDSDIVALGRALGLDATAEKVTYGTEAGIYSNGGIECVVCGPGDIADAHRPNESIDIDQLGACDAFLGRLIDHLRA